MTERSTVVEDPDQRWEQGIPHHPLAEELMQEVAALDLKYGLHLDLEFGGDGDNGEHLLFLLSAVLEKRGPTRFLPTELWVVAVCDDPGESVYMDSYAEVSVHTDATAAEEEAARLRKVHPSFLYRVTTLQKHVFEEATRTQVT